MSDQKERLRKTLIFLRENGGVLTKAEGKGNYLLVLSCEVEDKVFRVGTNLTINYLRKMELNVAARILTVLADSLVTEVKNSKRGGQ